MDWLSADGAASGLEIFYLTAAFGSINISPADEERFMEELSKQMAQVSS